jgi:WD40 repeat protein
MDADVMAAMGISGFGKQTRKRQLDAARFDKAKREEVLSSHVVLNALLIICMQVSAPSTSQGRGQGASPPHAKANPPPPPGFSGSAAEDVDTPEPHAAASAQPDEPPAEEPEYDPDEEYGTSGQGDLSEFPVTHELILKDHTKVVSALALDPSGARIVSGSHDYDCKLWDFGGMDHRCKPFKSWEPAESYHVRPPNICTILAYSNVEWFRFTI